MEGPFPPLPYELKQTKRGQTATMLNGQFLLHLCRKEECYRIEKWFGGLI